jgi:hypothetical protein
MGHIRIHLFISEPYSYLSPGSFAKGWPVTQYLSSAER